MLSAVALVAVLQVQAEEARYRRPLRRYYRVVRRSRPPDPPVEVSATTVTILKTRTSTGEDTFRARWDAMRGE